MKPNINVTPLIDVLLVLLIIFMVITPSKPSGFNTKLPAESKTASNAEPHPHTLVVIVDAEGRLAINRGMPTAAIDDPAPVIAALKEVFAVRERDGMVRYGTNEIERTVFINAPKSLPYGAVVKVVDAVKMSGAEPVALQLDGLN